MFVCASQEDTSPVSVAEALACGRPCIAFAVGGLPEMISHGINGWLASPGDPSALAEGIKWVTTHPHPDELRRAAREKALAEYQLDMVVEKYAALYATVTRDRKKKKRL
jgi:glycosyltransferase involved in cell wall biosynthesis